MSSGSFGYGGQNYDNGYQHVKDAQVAGNWNGGVAQNMQLPPPSAVPRNDGVQSQPQQHGIFLVLI